MMVFNTIREANIEKPVRLRASGVRSPEKDKNIRFWELDLEENDPKSKEGDDFEAGSGSKEGFQRERKEQKETTETREENLAGKGTKPIHQPEEGKNGTKSRRRDIYRGREGRSRIRIRRSKTCAMTSLKQHLDLMQPTFSQSQPVCSR